MSNPVDFLKQIDVATPCSARWDDMTGDDRSRFCGLCKKHVYNLSAMKTQEAAQLIQEKEQKLCVRFYRRADGTILTTDCPVGVRERLDRMLSKVIALVIALFASTFLNACKSKQTDTPIVKKQSSTDAVLGEFAILGSPAAKPTDTKAKH